MRAILARDAAALGWSYRPLGDPRLLGITAPPFGMGDAQRVSDVVTGSRPAGAFVAFTLELVLRPGRSDEHVRRWRVASVPLPQITPQIALSPDGALAAFLGAEALQSGVHDVMVESHAFNERWRVGADDPDYAHAVLTPAVVAALLDAPDDVGCITIENGTLVAASMVPVLEVGWISQALQTLEAVRAGIPPFVWDRWGTQDEGVVAWVPDH
ncbi:hypothetical protein [Demequina aestuarii]|uniref:hypothetical protein n=1 Tax=Demequina aestuarii TaxID=327095 RepID=UPI000780ABD1|nr:hypothetical protein [Demequina aestuarii]